VADAIDTPDVVAGPEAAAETGTPRPIPSSSPDGSGGIRRPRRKRKGEGRGRPPSLLFDLRSELPARWRWALAVLGLVGVMALWIWAASRPSETVVVPSPGDTLSALRDLWTEGKLWDDLTASGGRIFYGYAISMAIGIVLGVLMGSLQSAQATFEAPIAFMRYVPASALTPLMLSWFDLGETPKITLIVLGTVFFNILMVADVARGVPRELIEASYTLGARRTTVLGRVVFRHSLPGIIDVARINLAAGWLMLVVAELLAADSGLAFRIMKAQRSHGYDRMFAVLLVFGVIGVITDLALRALRDVSSPWAKSFE
jgi:NitT/TauT family transport system permease protein